MSARPPEIKHTDQDSPEWVPAADQEQIVRAYGRIIDQMNGLDNAQLQPDF